MLLQLTLPSKKSAGSAADAPATAAGRLPTGAAGTCCCLAADWGTPALAACIVRVYNQFELTSASWLMAWCKPFVLISDSS